MDIVPQITWRFSHSSLVQTIQVQQRKHTGILKLRQLQLRLRFFLKIKQFVSFTFTFSCLLRKLHRSKVTGSSDGFVQQRGHVLLLVSVRRAENHHAVLGKTFGHIYQVRSTDERGDGWAWWRTARYLDRQGVQVVQHDVVGLREQRGVTLTEQQEVRACNWFELVSWWIGPGVRCPVCTYRDTRVLVEQHLQQVRGQDGGVFEFVLRFDHVPVLLVGARRRAGQVWVAPMTGHDKLALQSLYVNK